MVGTKQSEVTLKRLVDEREGIHRKHESKLAEVNSREDPMPSEDERDLLKRYREDLARFDEQIIALSDAVEKDRLAEEESRKLRRALSGEFPGAEADGDGIVYRDFFSYGFDFFIARSDRVPEAAKIVRQWGVTEEQINQAKMRQELVRTPANTLSSNVAGLIPPQHLADIFQVIDRSRPLVESGRRVGLERGTLTYPQVDTRPVVAVQSAEKTEAGNTGMAISMVTKTATTYLGGGNLSWQAINWSTPSALRTWFDLIAADYALKTETDAATVVSASAFLNNISSTLGATPTFAELMAGIGSGGGEVYANSGRMADTVYMAPDRYWYALGLTSDADLSFGQSALLNVNGEERNLRVVVSRGLNAGEIIVGDSDALLVAETPGAPVEMQVVEPAIGGVEVGLIGAFEAAVVDDGAFALITTAS
jgi:hypothetical protein